jgi:phenylpropionate dioxygenase-like ring-hydroxylating dioxygenase large terminal subunit
MLINNWYVAAAAGEVTGDAPVGVRMLGLDFVLYRSDGQVRCLSNVCCHRGGALCDGSVTAGRLACPYHGWQFDGDGRCATIPALGPDARIPKRARVDAYPAVEKYGWIWVFLGDLPEHERPPIPDLFPEFDDTAHWRRVPYRFEAAANWVRMEENSLDTIHTSFVHRRFGGRVDPQSAAMDIELLPYGARVSREKHAPDSSRNSPDLARLLPADRTRTRVSIEFSIVGICHRIQPTFREGMSQINFTARTPVDEFHTRAFGWQARNYLLEPEHDAERIRGLQEAIEEDLRVVERVRPRLTPPGLPEEFLTKADSMEVAFRRLVRQWAERGWEIDSRCFAEESNEHVLVIPSPARREDPKNWLHRPVPLHPARDATSGGGAASAHGQVSTSSTST